ncbi:uncharacterized transporter slc-17.2-like [Haliotis rufescens]|uniref:uncharacterized transporter slc-17.2-like n=1 Tax=Haliotis rufescens TaxID=6454 RepID=UPI00201F8150|nr:uncharacterized transporter slc-17.2-like [Haliotis rufescens]
MATETTPVRGFKDSGPSEYTNLETCCGKYTSWRWVTGYLCCSVYMAQTALRQCMGMAVVAMVMPLSVPEVTSMSPAHDNAVRTSEFTWTSKFEGLILSAFTFGFLGTPIIGGYIAGKYGGKIVITVSLVVASTVTIATPEAARALPISLVILRAIVGIFMGTVEPAIMALWAEWAPEHEKASLTSCSYAGLSIAGILTFFISGYLGGVSLDNGWPLIFYVFGGFTLMCVFPWVLFVSDSPRDHPRITETEVKLITRERTYGQLDTKAQFMLQMPRPPWGKIFTSPAFWAILIAHICHSWLTSWVMAYLPKYMKQILKYGIEQDGVWSSAPFAGRLLVGLASAFIIDWVLSRRLLSTTNARKTFQLMGCVGCAVCIIPVGFLDHENGTLAVTLLILGISLQNCASVAFRINHLDIAPRFAGVLMGITVTCAMVASLSAPLITSYVIKQGTREEWQILFWIIGGLNIVSGCVFVVFGKGTELDWAKDASFDVVSAHRTHDGDGDGSYKP